MCLVGSVAGAGSGASSSVGVSSRFCIKNILLLKLSWFFSLTPRNNPRLFKKDLFSSSFTPLFILFNSFINLLCLLSASSNVNFLSNISLKKQ